MKIKICILLLALFVSSCWKQESPSIEHQLIGEYIVNSPNGEYWILNDDGKFLCHMLANPSIGGCGKWSFNNGELHVLGTRYIIGTLKCHVSPFEDGWILREIKEPKRIFELKRQ